MHADREGRFRARVMDVGVNATGPNKLCTVVLRFGLTEEYADGEWRNVEAEELAVAWTIGNVPHEKGNRIVRIEDYGFGKGYQHVYETFLTLLGDLDRHVRAGRNVILICHDCCTNVPNPQGEDWQRYEPRLQSPSSGKASIRLRVREWADHVFFLGYDVDVKEGKGHGCGTRTLWPVEMPHCMAKSRRLADPIPVYPNDAAVWTALFGNPQTKEE